MRPGTALVLLGLVLMVAFFGWRAFGYLVLFGLLLVVVAVGAVALALYRIKRRLEQTVQEAARQFQQAAQARGAPPDASAGPSAAARRDAIDVDAVVRKPRDGADDPDNLGTGR